MCIFCLHMCASFPLVPLEAREDQIPENQSSRWLRYTMHVLRIKPRSSARTVSALNCIGTSPLPIITLEKFA